MMVGKRDGVIKGECSENEAMTAFGGLAVAEALACRTRLWSDLRKLLPERCANGQGYASEAVVAALVYGLLSGGHGTAAGEALREDAPLRELAGLEAGSPEEATVWRALGDLGKAGEKLAKALRKQAARLLERTDRGSMLVEGFFPIFGDGTNLEVARWSKFEGKKTFDGTSKLQWATLWCGPYLAAQGFAGEGQGEAGAVRALIEPAWKHLLAPGGLKRDALWLMDSLYGDGPCLEALEACEGSHYIVGANKLPGVEKAAREQPASQWADTGEDKARGWVESALCVHTYQAEGWESPRAVVTRRFKVKNELFERYASVFVSLGKDHPKMARMMAALGGGKGAFARAVWKLYDRKQAMENQFKDALSDLGLHHPPCRELSRNTAFYGVAALALNLSLGVRRIALPAEERSMRLWRLRRELFCLAGRVARHARRTLVTIHASGARARERFLGALARIAAT